MTTNRTGTAKALGINDGDAVTVLARVGEHGFQVLSASWRGTPGTPKRVTRHDGLWVAEDGQTARLTPAARITVVE